MKIAESFVAFDGDRLIGRGGIAAVAGKVKKHADRKEDSQVLVFDGASSRRVEIDLRGTMRDVLERVAREQQAKVQSAEPEEKRGPGRPKLGVVAREVTLLPRHWEWLNSQPGGASVALRKLVEEARRARKPHDEARESQESAHRFMTAMAGDLPGYEEALRAFYAGDARGVRRNVSKWPKDVREHLGRLVRKAMRDREACESMG